MKVRVVKYKVMQGGVSYRLRAVEYDLEDTRDVIFIHPEEIILHSLAGRYELGTNVQKLVNDAIEEPAIDYDLWCAAHAVNLPVIIDTDTKDYDYFFGDLDHFESKPTVDEDYPPAVFENVSVGGSNANEIEDSFDELFEYLDDKYDILSEHRWFALISENFCVAVNSIKEIDMSDVVTRSEKQEKIHLLLQQVRKYTGRVLNNGK